MTTTKTTIDKAALLAPAETVERDIPGFGVARIRRLTRSQRIGLQTWLRPDGELDPVRRDNFDVKLSTLCLVGQDDQPLFQVDSDEDFSALLDQIAEADSVTWDRIGHEVMLVNGYIEEVEEADTKAVLGKLRDLKETLISFLPFDSPESWELMTLMGWSTDYQTKHGSNGSVPH